MVVCPKKNGKPRRTVDFQALNAHAIRETHHTQSPFHQARSVPQNKKKSVFDAWNGYHSVPIRDEDKHRTTFITPWGRYRYRTAPQGYIASGDGYTRRFDEIVSDVPNKTKCVDDALLCSEEPDYSVEDATLQSAASAISSLEPITWNKVKIATTSDVSMAKLVDLIETGMPESRLELPTALREFHQFREHLHTVDGVVLYKDRIVIPPALREDALTALHSAHQGISSMMSRAEASIFWPGLTLAVTTLRTNCAHCNQMAPSQPSAPPTPLVYPSYPFQCLCADFFHYKGVNYLVLVDRYSNWPIVERTAGGAPGLINCLRRTFVTFGIPDELSSDGGPEFTASATREFLHTWSVHHRLSSVAFPHSNCRAEIGVKTVKRMITDNTGPQGELDTDAFQGAMLQYSGGGPIN
ncbi:uncharacterized protein K02A2.6-like [Haliotis rubra]|uniref:uncharacterized protein K02A2.6-like n=1 Tax=Haliotis rubra TaxID=36100 RepID=UPI001EE60640|nr:uncharacterized protein K02A2.6-like [Haliotis rubra]